MTTLTHLPSILGLTEDELSDTFKKCFICHLCPPECSAPCSLLSVSLLLITHHYPKARGGLGWEEGPSAVLRVPAVPLSPPWPPLFPAEIQLKEPFPAHGSGRGRHVSLTSYPRGGSFPPTLAIALLTDCTWGGVSEGRHPNTMAQQSKQLLTAALQASLLWKVGTVLSPKEGHPQRVKWLGIAAYVWGGLS